MHPVAALASETLTCREVISHPEVVDRIGQAHRKLQK
jgi:hypothetical protein